MLPIDIFDSEYFAENYHYDGTDLGAVIHGDSTTFKVWAPTASKVVLNLFEAGDGVEAYKSVDMVLGEKGVWSHTEACGHGTYYTYTVTTSVGTQEAVDPYAKSAGVNATGISSSSFFIFSLAASRDFSKSFQKEESTCSIVFLPFPISSSSFSMSAVNS